MADLQWLPMLVTYACFKEFRTPLDPADRDMLRNEVREAVLSRVRLDRRAIAGSVQVWVEDLPKQERSARAGWRRMCASAYAVPVTTEASKDADAR